MRRLLFLIPWVLVCALYVAVAGTASAAPQYHQGLGDSALSSEARDVPGDLRALGLPLATPNQPGCLTDLLSRNFSSRAGKRPELLVAHYTVSSNRPGWGDVNAIHSWFSQERAQASSNYIIDFEGNCKYIVSETAKAWTQGYFNPWSISIEFIATGREEKMSEAAYRRGAQVFADAARRWGIPLKLVNPSGCEVPSGITDHNRLECDNNHTDIAPFSLSKLIRYTREAYNPPPPKFRFLALGKDGQEFARSGAVLPADEARVLENFLHQIGSGYAKEGLASALTRLRAKGEIRIQRTEDK